VNIVIAENLTRKFGDVTAVSGLNIEIAEGEIFALVGPDGAGKTTTMRMLCGLMNPTEGRAIVTGLDVAKSPDEVKDHIGYMAQKFGLYTDLTVDENMNFYGDLFGIVGKEREALSTRLLQMTRMEPFRARQAGKLSGGMKQKLALMCTLLHKPKVLFLDEPTNGVDPVSRRDFWAILYELVRDGLTVMVATAYLDEAERANRVGMMHLGKLIRCATPAALRSELTEACYSVTSADLRKTRAALTDLPGVVTVQPSGADLHLFLDEGKASVAQLAQQLTFDYRRISPSLEDVFIALVKREELTRAA
jgi:ABC-2 type transport system ATP-binding protein